MNNKFILSIAMMSAVAANNVMAADNGFYLGGAIGTTGIDDGGLYKDSLMPITVDAEAVFFKIVVIICLVIKQLLFLDLNEPHQLV
ncbi:MAG: hypothetical protein R3Y30_16750, partial [Vibrio sp.]